MKHFALTIFIVAALAQWAAPLSQIWIREQTLTKGTLIKLKCSAPDPYDPLRGRFLAVKPEQNTAPTPKDTPLPRDTRVYGALTIGTDGLATVSSISLTPPRQGDYISLKTTYGSPDGKVYFLWPFERFYINEKLAPEADKWFQENIRSTTGIIAEVRVLKGRAVLADLSMDGKPFREILKTRLK